MELEESTDNLFVSVQRATCTTPAGSYHNLRGIVHVRSSRRRTIGSRPNFLRMRKIPKEPFPFLKRHSGPNSTRSALSSCRSTVCLTPAKCNIQLTEASVEASTAVALKRTRNRYQKAVQGLKTSDQFFDTAGMIFISSKSTIGTRNYRRESFPLSNVLRNARSHQKST